MSSKFSFQVFCKTALGLILALALASCAVAPDGGDAAGAQAAGTMSTAERNAQLSQAFDAYERRNFASAHEGFEALTESGNADTERLAWLGIALVRVSTDPDWRDPEAARVALQSAESTEGAPGIAAGMLINALSSLILIEADMSAVTRQQLNTAYEAREAEAEINALREERDALLAEQERLNEALEKLKELTIGN